MTSHRNDVNHGATSFMFGFPTMTTMIGGGIKQSSSSSGLEVTTGALSSRSLPLGTRELNHRLMLDELMIMLLTNYTKEQGARSIGRGY
jgi:hypothetical protein